MRLPFLLFLIFTLVPILNADPPYKAYLLTGSDKDRDGKPDRDDNCNTVSPKLYDSETAVTFWGDSRLDLVNTPLYGAGSLDSYFAATGWNVQNFGVTARQSIGLNQEVKECFSREVVYVPLGHYNSEGKWEGGDPLKPYYTNFKVSKNIAFEIGGNDFAANWPAIYVLPTLFISYVDKAGDNIYYTIKYLRIKERNVLVIGNYPAVSWSLKLGNPKQYAWDGVFNPRSIAISEILRRDHPDPTWIAKTWEELVPYLKRYIATIAASMINPIVGLFVAAHAIQGSPELDAVIQSGTLQTNAQIKTLPVGSYQWWLKINKEAVGTIPSLGVAFLELRIRDIISDESKFSPEYYAGTSMQYVSTFEYFLHPETPLEPYVANPVLMGDPIHKNHLGYAVWGAVVSNKIRALNWHVDHRFGDSTFFDQADINLEFALEKIKKKYEARLLLIESELNSKIALINQGITDVTQRIFKIQEAKRLAELARLEALRIKAEQDQLAEDEANRERARLQAEEQSRRAEADRRWQEEQRIATEELANRVRQQHNEQLLLLASCFLFGVCHL